MLAADMTNEYGAFIKNLMSDETPIVFHCSHGVHRTGTAAAIFLSILGVPWKTVRDDYMLTNIYRAEETKVTLQKLQQMAAENLGIPLVEVDMTNANAFYLLEGAYIDATRDIILEQYGSFENYANEGLGLTETEIEKLRTIFLQ